MFFNSLLTFYFIMFISTKAGIGALSYEDSFVRMMVLCHRAIKVDKWEKNMASEYLFGPYFNLNQNENLCLERATHNKII